MSRVYVHTSWVCPKCMGDDGFDESHGPRTLQCLRCGHVWLDRSTFLEELHAYKEDVNRKMRETTEAQINALLADAEERALRPFHDSIVRNLELAKENLQLHLESGEVYRESDMLRGMIDTLEAIRDDLEMKIGPKRV